MKLYIKNMVCNRCIMVVHNELESLGLQPQSVLLGEADITENISEEEKQEIKKKLNQFGFELIDDKKSRIIEKVKTCLIELIYYPQEPLKMNISVFLAEKIGYDYSYISNLFSEVQGISIEQYFISQKIERVKELLIYNELSLSQIANELNYSSVSHLSKQFKKITGQTPSQFKQIKENKRKTIDNL